MLVDIAEVIAPEIVCNYLVKPSTESVNTFSSHCELHALGSS